MYQMPPMYQIVTDVSPEWEPAGLQTVIQVFAGRRPEVRLNHWESGTYQYGVIESVVVEPGRIVFRTSFGVEVAECEVKV